MLFCACALVVPVTAATVVVAVIHVRVFACVCASDVEMGPPAKSSSVVREDAAAAAPGRTVGTINAQEKSWLLSRIAKEYLDVPLTM